MEGYEDAPFGALADAVAQELRALGFVAFSPHDEDVSAERGERKPLSGACIEPREGGVDVCWLPDLRRLGIHGAGPEFAALVDSITTALATALVRRRFVVQLVESDPGEAMIALVTDRRR